MNKLEKLEQGVKDAQAVYTASGVVYANSREAVAVAKEEAWDVAVYVDEAYDSAYDASKVDKTAYDDAETAFKLAKKKLNDYLEGQAND